MHLRMEAGDEPTILGGAGGDVDALIKEVGATMAAMKTLGNNIVVRSQMCSALAARVDARPFEVDHGIIFLLSRLGSSRLGLR